MHNGEAWGHQASPLFGLDASPEADAVALGMDRECHRRLTG